MKVSGNIIPGPGLHAQTNSTLWFTEEILCFGASESACYSLYLFFCKPNAGQLPDNYSFWFKSLLMQNSAARLVTNTNRVHISPIPTSLLWVPVQFRIQYKVLCALKVYIEGHLVIFLKSSASISHRPLRSEPTAPFGLILIAHYILHLKLICSLWPLQQHCGCCVLERYNVGFSFCFSCF